MIIKDIPPQWWSREDLLYEDGRLVFAGRLVDDLALQFGTPVFFYNFSKVRSNLRRLHSALQSSETEIKYKIYYAMKANRFAPLLTALKQTGLCGIDACSPNEVEFAIQSGFVPEDISYTGTSLSRNDLNRILRIPGVRLNVDSIETLRQVGLHAPGRDIGLRVNPGVGIGRTGNEKLHYSGNQTTKFGIYLEQFPEAIKVAEKFNLNIKRIHFHTGCGYLDPELKQLEEIIDICFGFVDQLKSVNTVNIGGGLGVPHTEKDKSLNLDRWAQIVTKKIGERGLKLELEPGDYIVKNAGILLLNVNYIEQKRDKNFVFLNGGFNLAVEPTVYGLPFEPVPALYREGTTKKVSLAGNINEALDIWYNDIELPTLKENDTMAFINAGAYSSSMASNHCLRGDFKEFLLL